MDIIWIAWEDDASIRSKVLAKELNAKFFTFTKFEGKKNYRLLRYFVAIWQTITTVYTLKPQVLVVQNPSIILAFTAAFCKYFFSYSLVIDLHTQYIHPQGIVKWFMAKINTYALNRGNIVIVTNESYKNIVQKKNKSEIVVLPDKIPDLLQIESTPFVLKGKNNILYICTFSTDEPWQEVIKAATMLDSDIYIYITGKHPKNLVVASNIVLTGFLPLEEYHYLLQSADAIVVLTSEENCLVCGGYEAVAATKPLILSNTKTLQEYFFMGANFTENKAKNISQNIEKIIIQREDLQKQVVALKNILTHKWKSQWSLFIDKVNSINQQTIDRP